ncbi:apolipoprotein N-acyltransferase [Thalassotalea ponticola]|uniref:apolipoprotein N-acyltransferase n=1 Tax=Thalassotalea ponticola TaxID=1523392 RepID=UPI0025B40DC0|nr:apolipoprotein N-acyltransferase [Thalassotalea ponticola]MDN3653220.1 apolipoprotein N-acyltransferase [Thalassotalea ponticola]
MKKAALNNRLLITNSLLALLFCFFSGAIATLAFAPFGYWPLAFVSVILWLSQIDQLDAWQATKRSFAWGLGYFSFGISWVHVSIEQFGGLPLLVSLLLMLLLCGYLALFPAFAAWISSRLTRTQHVSILLLPMAWLLSEYLRSVLLTGFPWLALGYSQIDGPLAPLAPIVGEIGISVLMMCICTSLCLLVNKRRITLASLGLLVIAISTVISQQLSFTQVKPNSFSAALVQGNIEQQLRWDEQAEQDIIDLYVNLSEPLYSQHDIVIWPEAAIPRLEPLAQDTLRLVNQTALANNSSVITGIINYQPQSREFFNSIVVLGKHSQDDQRSGYYYGNSNTFNKHHLLPIGEFVPFGDLLRTIAPLFNLPMSSFTAGDYVQNNLLANGIQLLPLICFEIVFADQLAANLTANTDAILTISNDAWFGDSHGPHQHLEIARMRALEFGKPVIRATNNGLTAVINEHGTITEQIPQFTQATLSASINKVQGNTPYATYGSLVHTVLVSLIAIVFLLRFGQLRYRRPTV